MPSLTLPRLLLPFVLLALLLPVAPARAEKHMIILDRDRKVGDKYRATYEAKHIETQTQLLGEEKDVQKKTRVGRMTAVVVVLEVDKKKGVKKVILEIERFDVRFNGERVKLDKSKRIIVTGNNGNPRYTFEDGKALPLSVVNALDFVSEGMVENKSEELEDTKVFKLTEPRELGTTWECDNKLMAKKLSESGDLRIKPEDIESKFEFSEVAKFNGVPAAAVDMKFTMKNLGFPGADGSGFKFTKAVGEATMHAMVPLDPKAIDRSRGMTMKMDVEGFVTGPKGKLKLIMDIDMQSRAEYREIK